MDGQVVHARRGQRETYAPLRSPLSPSADPAAVVAGLLRLFPFQTIYIADLDALQGKPPQTALIAELVQGLPAVTFWLDAGAPAAGPAHGPQVAPVLGSEALRDDNLERLTDLGPEAILSLDFYHGRLLGPARLLEQPALWPERIILMNLSQVGSLEGPDVAGAAHFIRHHPRHRWIAAGGVRDAGDLATLARSGVAAVLVASAIHNGAIDAGSLRHYHPLRSPVGP